MSLMLASRDTGWLYSTRELPSVKTPTSQSSESSTPSPSAVCYPAILSLIVVKDEAVIRFASQLSSLVACCPGRAYQPVLLCFTCPLSCSSSNLEYVCIALLLVSKLPRHALLLKHTKPSWHAPFPLLIAVGDYLANRPSAVELLPLRWAWS